MQRVAHHYVTLVVAHTDLPPADERQTILIGAKLAQVTVAFPVCACMCTDGLVIVCRAEPFVKQLIDVRFQVKVLAREIAGADVIQIVSE